MTTLIFVYTPFRVYTLSSTLIFIFFIFFKMSALPLEHTHYRAYSFLFFKKIECTHNRVHSPFEYKHLRTTLFTEYGLLCLYSFFVLDNRSRHKTTAYRISLNCNFIAISYITTFFTTRIITMTSLLRVIIKHLISLRRSRSQLLQEPLSTTTHCTASSQKTHETTTRPITKVFTIVHYK